LKNSPFSPKSRRGTTSQAADSNLDLCYFLRKMAKGQIAKQETENDKAKKANKRKP